MASSAVEIVPCSFSDYPPSFFLDLQGAAGELTSTAIVRAATCACVCAMKDFRYLSLLIPLYLSGAQNPVLYNTQEAGPCCGVGAAASPII